MTKLSRKKKAEVIAMLSVIVMIIGILIGNIYSTNDNHYVLDVIKESATNCNDNIEIAEKIVKESNEQYYNAKELDYELSLKNIKQANMENQVAIVVDSSYSMETNDTNNVVKSKAIEFAKGIRDNVKNVRFSISNNNNVKMRMSANASDITIENTINNMITGEGYNSNDGLDNANSTFVSPIKNENVLNKYIVVFTDATDNVTEKMRELTEQNPNVKIISILVDMTSSSYIIDNTPINGEVYLLLSEVEEGNIVDNIEILDLQKIYDNMNKVIRNVIVSNEFSNEVLNYFDITDYTIDKGNIEKIDTGYIWNIDKIENEEIATLKFKLSLKTNTDIDAGVIFNEIYTNKKQEIKYNNETLNGVDSREGTEATVIKICQGYDLKIKAVNESNTDLEVEGVEFKVLGINENEEEVCNLTKTTDAEGYITITAEETRALRADGTIQFTATPNVNKVGYSKTDSVYFSITNDKITRKLKFDNKESSLEGNVNEQKRSVEVIVPINSQKIDFELKVQELNNDSVSISDCEFELIQPKLNNKYEMDILSGITDETGTIHFAPTVMTKNGTYNYILRQVSAPNGYEITTLTLVTIKFEDGVIVDKPEIQFNPNITTELCEDTENHVLIIVGNECVQKDPFNLQINLSDVDSGDKLEGVTYLISTTNANNQTRSEYVTTDNNGQINTDIYGNGNLNIKITEQTPKVGYMADNNTKEIIVSRNNGVITIWNSSTNLNVEQSPNKDDIIVNLNSKKKLEQNILKLKLVDIEEQDVPVGAGVQYSLLDTETGRQYGPEISDRKGELSFTIDTKEQGQHMFKILVDDNTIPDEYNEMSVEKEIKCNLVFDKDGYIQDVNIIDDDKTVIDSKYVPTNNNDSVEYTAFITIGYEMEQSNTIQFKTQLLDKDDLRNAIEGGTYNVDIEWDINGTTRTKTITGRKTNSNGEIVTRIIKGEEVRIFVTQVGTRPGYNVDNTTQEIYLTFNNNGTINITQSPYDRGETNTQEPEQGAYVESGNIVYRHLNRKRTSEDTYVNLTINKIDTNNAYVDGVILNIKSKTLVDKNNNALDLIVKTGEQGSEGTVTIDYEQYLKDEINNNIIRVPGIGEESNEIVYDLEISEMKVDSQSETGYSIKNGTTVKLRLIFRYRDGRVTLTNVETIYGNRLVKSKTFSSASDTEEGQISEDSMGVYLSNILLDLYTNYDDVGNLAIDFKKENQSEEKLTGAKYNLKVTNPDGTVVRKEISISNGDESSDIEISGLNVNVGSIIELTETEAPIGYGINANTETLEVTDISNDGEITLEQKDISYNPNRLKVEKLVNTTTSSGNIKTNYEVTFIDYQLDTFGFEITTKDSNTQKGVEGFGFNIDTSKGAKNTLVTGKDGFGSVKVGGNLENYTITYTISTNKLADYYKPLNNLINVNVVFDTFGNVDTAATMQAQTDINYGNLWTITTLEDSNNGKIGIQILVEHQDPLVVKLETIDKITNTKLAGTSYKITESEELPAIGTDTIEVGYTLQNGTRTYNLIQTSIKDSYQAVADKSFTVEYTNEKLTNATLSSTTSEDNITITGNKEVTIKIFVEPKVPFEISNFYYFDTKTKLQGANFEIVSQRNQDTGTGTTDANGMTGIYSDIFGTNEEVIYKVRQTKGANGYATVEDFYVKVNYNENREIVSAILTDEHGTEVTNNRFITVSYAKTSTYSQYNSNDKGIVKIQVLNYPEFKFVIKNVDRRDGITPIVGTEYSVTSTYDDSENNKIDFTKTLEPAVTNEDGIGTAHLDKTKDNTVVTYTIKEDRPATNYQSLGTDIKVIVTFDENGYVSNVEVENNDNLSKIETASKVDPIVDDRDRFIVNLELKNNPILKFNLTAADSVDHDVKIKDIGFQIVSTINDEIYSNSSATNNVNQTENPETSYTDVNGYTASYLDRTVDNREMIYTIKEVQKASGYEWNEQDIIIKVSYDANGKISSITPVQGSGAINITSYDSDNFEINMEIYNDEIKEFGIHLTTADTYDIDKKLNNMKVEAYLTETGNNSYTPDEKYALIEENALLTGADRNNDGKADLSYGEDYKTIGAYTEDAGTRTLRLVIKNDSHHTAQSGYYLDSYDGTESGNNVGYYKGTQYHSDAKYQTVKYEYLINVTFDDDGKIVNAKLLTGLNSDIGWLTDNRYIEVDENGYLTHTDYRLNITMKFFPMLDLKLNAMDNYTYEDEINENGKPFTLEGTKYTISTTRHYTGSPTQEAEYIKAGYIGHGNTYGYHGQIVKGDIYEDTDELFAPIEKNETRLFFVFEESEPNNYQKYTDRHLIHYEQRLIAIIQVTFDEYGEIDYDNSIVRKVDENTIKPYMAENGTTYLSSNNIKEYNYWYGYNDSKRDIDFYIGYALTTKINITAVDDISGSPISNIRMYPFVNSTIPVPNNNYDICLTNTSYEYSTIGYRDTNTKGQVGVKYWGASATNNVNQYIIGSSRHSGNYNGYLFPSDMASSSLGGSGNSSDYYAKLDVQYNDKGKISSVTSLGADLWGDNNVAEITWDSKTGNVYINMLYSRKFQMTLNKTDFYDATINKLNASFDVISNKGLKTSIDARKMTPIGKIYKDTTVKYTLSETQIPEGYYPLTNTIDYYVTFDKNGNIGINTVKSESEYFEVVNTSDNTEKINKTSPDLTINIKNKPAFNLDIKVIDKFYKDDGLANVYLNVTNDKEDIALGNPQTDENGYVKVVTGPVYPNETVKYYINQTSTAPGYYPNSTIVELEVKFNDVGKVEDYKILSGNEVINQFNPTDYMNKRTIGMDIMNMPKDLKIGLYKFDKLTNEPMADVPFTVTKENVNSGEKSETKILTNSNGAVVEKIDTFDTSLNGKVVKYTIHEDETPASYRTMEDVVFLVYYNADGSISMKNQIENENGVLNEDVVPEVAIGKIKYLNDERVHIITQVPNDNAFDIIVKNEDINYNGLGIEGSKFDVSVNGVKYTPNATDENGKTEVSDITTSGDITINIAQNEVGEGYKSDIDNKVQIDLVKGIDIYSIDLKTTTAGYIDDKNATTLKAIVEVDEVHGKIYVTFKNETKTEITVFKQDINSKIGLRDTEFEVIAQKVDNEGNNVGNPIVLTTNDNKVTDINGQLYFNIGVAPQSEIWKYTFKEITPPQGYNAIVDLTMTVTYDQYGRISKQESSKQSRLVPAIATENENCRSMYAIIYNGDVSPAYTVKVVTEDVDTGKRINGSSIHMNITDNNGDLIQVLPKTQASAQNGGTSITGNLGIDGKMYTDEEVNNKEKPTPIIIEKGLTYIDNVDYEGTVNIEVSQTGLADGYIFGNQKTDGNIKIEATYIPHLDEDPTVEFTVKENDGFNVTVDNTNRMITIKILNQSQVSLDIVTSQYKTNTEEETKYIQGVNYNITSEIQTAVDSIQTDLNETTPLSDESGRTKGNVGTALAGKIVVYTLHQNLPTGYKTIDDIKVEVHYDTKGYIKYYEILTSEDNAYIDEDKTTGRSIALIVQNRKELAGYRVDVEKHAMDTDEDEEAYLSKTLPGAKFKITVEQQNGIKNTSWVDITDANGLIKGLTFDGTGYITVTIEELEAPEGYTLDTTKFFRLYRDPNTGEIEKVDGNVNINDKNLETDEEGRTIVKLMPIDAQSNNKFTLILNKYSTATGKYITEDQAEFKAELIRKDEEGNIIYQDTIENIRTNKNGKAIMDNQDMPGEEGEYKLVITELKAPEGYEGLPEPIEIPVTFVKDAVGNIVINKVSVEGLENVSTSKVNNQLIGLNIGNDVIIEDIKDDEYSLDITKVDSETGEAIENMAVFKVLLPDDKNTSVYAETTETLLGPGKLDYCYIEQDKNYQVRLTHMKQPKEEGELTYVFKEISSPEGYQKPEEDIELTLEFKRDETTGKMYIANIKSNSEKYLRINTITPCPTDTSLSIDILNYKEKQEEEKTEFTVHYDANDNGQGTKVPEDQIKQKDIDLVLNTMQPTRDDYIFIGWAVLPTSTSVEFKPGDTYSLNQDITLYAVWVSDKYEVTFKNDDGTIIDTITVNYMEDAEYTEETPIKNNVPQGYEATFNGWDDESKLKNIKEDTTVTATYVLSPITYTITYENLKGSDNSENPTSYTIEDKNIILKDLPNKENLIFKGWYTTNDDTGVKVTSIDTSKLENIVLYAQWEDDGNDDKEKLYLRSDVYRIEDDIVSRVNAETTVSEFIDNLISNATTLIVYDKEGNRLDDNSLVGTEMYVVATKDDEQIICSISVIGDLNGDGRISLVDVSRIESHYLEIETISDFADDERAIKLYELSADINDDRRISLVDVSKVESHYLDIEKLY